MGDTQRISSLDGLRGAAAATVVAAHAFLTIPALAAAYFGQVVPSGVQWLVYSPLHLLWDGSPGVFVFFILSGFVVPLPALHSSRFRWRVYFPQRFIRLYVPVWASLLLAYALIALVPRDSLDGRSAWVQWHEQSFSLGTMLRDAALVGGVSAANSPLWTLHWEIVFSLLLPVYVFAARWLRRRPIVWTVTFIVLAAVGGYFHIPALTYLPMFAIGLVLALKQDELIALAGEVLATRHSWLLRVALGVVAVGCLSSRWLLTPTLGPAAELWAFGPTVVGAAVVVVAALVDPAVSRFLNRRALAVAGMLSFSVYLVHEPIAVTLAFALPPQAVGFVPVLTVVLAVPTALAFHHGIERPSHALAKRVGRLFVRRPVVALGARTATD